MTKYGYFGAGATAVLTAALVALLIFGSQYREPILAEYLASQTDQLSDTALTAHFRRLADLESAGIPALVGSLASGRPAEREAALGVLEEVVARECATNAQSPCLHRLVQELAAAGGSFAQGPKEAALRWSSRIVRHQYRAGRRDPIVLAHCRRIQEASFQDFVGSPSVASVRVPEAQDSKTRLEDLARSGSENVVTHAQPAAEPAETLTETGRKAATDGIERQAVELSAPALLPPWLDTTLIEAPHLNLRPENSIDLAGLAEETRGLLSENPHAAALPIPTGQAENPETSSANVAPTTVQAELERRPEGIGDRDLLLVLEHDDPAVSGWAEDELLRRGVSHEVISLARLIAHPDPKVRTRLVSRLSQMPTAYRTLWLLEFTHDPHSEVRLAALESIGGTPEAQLEARVKEMGTDDPDEAVRRRARRLASGHAEAEPASSSGLVDETKISDTAKTVEPVPPKPEISDDQPSAAPSEDPWE